MLNEFWSTRRHDVSSAVTLMRISTTDAGPAITAVVVVGDDITTRTLKQVSMAAALGECATHRPSHNQPVALRELTAALAAAVEVAETESRGTLLEESCRLPLTRPDRNNPDGHSEAVAAAYVEHLRALRQPGVAIAEEAGVPVATARGWIREARRRGKLPKGRQGRAG